MTDLAPAPGPPRRSRQGSRPASGPTSRSCRAPCATAGPLVYLDSGATSQQAGAGARRRARRSTSGTTRRSTAARTSSPRRPPTPSSRARATIAGFIGAAARRGGVHQERHRGAQPGGLRVQQRRRAGAMDGVDPGVAGGSRSGPATRSSSPRWSTTPTSCRGRSSARRTGATLRWIPVTDDGRLDLTDLDTRADRAHQGARVHPRVQRAGHRQPGGDAGRRGPTRSAR